MYIKHGCDREPLEIMYGGTLQGHCHSQALAPRLLLGCSLLPGGLPFTSVSSCVDEAHPPVPAPFNLAPPLKSQGISKDSWDPLPMPPTHLEICLFFLSILPVPSGPVQDLQTSNKRLNNCNGLLSNHFSFNFNSLLFSLSSFVSPNLVL